MKFILSIAFLIICHCSQSYAQSPASLESGSHDRHSDLNSEGKYFKVYPNPSSGSVQLTILDSDIEQFKLKIYDVHGVLIFDKFFKGAFEGLNLNLTLKKSGLYILVIESGQQQFVEKIMVNS